MHGTIELEGDSELPEQASPPVPPVRVNRREAMLMLFIATVFGVGMIILVAAMCLAEISIQRGTYDTPHPAPSPAPLTLTASR